MTPSEIEQRFAKYDERIETLENELLAIEVQVRLLTDSHPEPTVLLSWVEATIGAARTQLASAKKPAGLARALARLEKVKVRVQGLIADRERAQQKAAAEKQRQRDELGRDIGRGGAGGPER